MNFPAAAWGLCLPTEGSGGGELDPVHGWILSCPAGAPDEARGRAGLSAVSPLAAAPCPALWPTADTPRAALVLALRVQPRQRGDVARESYMLGLLLCSAALSLELSATIRRRGLTTTQLQGVAVTGALRATRRRAPAPAGTHREGRNSPVCGPVEPCCGHLLSTPSPVATTWTDRPSAAGAGCCWSWSFLETPRDSLGIPPWGIELPDRGRISGAIRWRSQRISPGGHTPPVHVRADDHDQLPTPVGHGELELLLTITTSCASPWRTQLGSTADHSSSVASSHAEAHSMPRALRPVSPTRCRGGRGHGRARSWSRTLVSSRES